MRSSRWERVRDSRQSKRGFALHSFSSQNTASSE
jgi:hypothetical protein